MGKGKKSKASKATNPQQHMAEKQQMSERNVVQEEGFESDDEKTSGKSSMVKVDLRGSDSEEDNAAAGGGLVRGHSVEPKDRKNLQSPAPTNIHKKKNKASKQSHINSSAVSSSSTSSLYSAAPMNCSGTTPVAPDSSLSYDSLGHIIVRLLPAEHQVERLPDGRYIMKASAIGYLAQKLGHL